MDKPTDLIGIKITEIEPTHIGQRCPVCNGWTTVAHGMKKCPSCEGRGYILVPVEKIKSYQIPAKGVR